MGASHLEDIVSEKVNELLGSKRDMHLLEAGCGSASYFTFANVGCITGIDISPDQLTRNQVVQNKILGDLQRHPLPAETYDIVVCWDVIEHLSRPRDALANMLQSVKPGGVLVLGFPNPVSFKGLVTKFTPHRIHCLFYRHMKYEFRPFPTYMRMAIIPSRVLSLAHKHGFHASFQLLHEGGVTRRFKERFWPARVIFRLADAAVSVLSFGHSRSLCQDNCAFVLCKDKTPFLQT